MSQTITNFCDVCKVGIDKAAHPIHTAWHSDHARDFMGLSANDRTMSFYFNGRPLISLNHVDLCSAHCFETWCQWQVSKVKLAFAEYEKNKVEAF